MSLDNTRPVVVWLKGPQTVWDVTEPGTIIGMRVFCGGCGQIAEQEFCIVLKAGDRAQFTIANPHLLWKPGSRAVAYYRDDGVGGGPAERLKEPVRVGAPRELVTA